MRKQIVFLCKNHLFTNHNTQWSLFGVSSTQPARYIASLQTGAEPENADTKPSTARHVVEVAVLGATNAGKSTLINNLINHRVILPHTFNIQFEIVISL